MPATLENSRVTLTTGNQIAAVALLDSNQNFVGGKESGSAGTAKTDYSTTAGTTSSQAVPASTSARRMIMQNLDAAISVHFNLGAPATTAAGSLRLSPGAITEITGVSDAINIISASGTAAVTIWVI